MYCKKCGKEIGNAAHCPYCGTKIIRDAPSSGFAFLSFCIPVVGLILYIVWNNEYPQKAKSCLNGFIINIVCSIILFCCMMSSISSMYF